jgi:hypothetical protein
MPDTKAAEDKIAAAILTFASALRDQNLVSDGSIENIFGFYRRYLEAVKTDKLPSKYFRLEFPIWTYVSRIVGPLLPFNSTNLPP